MKVNVYTIRKRSMALQPQEKRRQKYLQNPLQTSPHDFDLSTQKVHLDLSIPSTRLDRLRTLRRPSIRNTLAAESIQHTRIRTRQRARSPIRIGLARVSEVLLTRRWRRVAVEKFTRESSLLRELDVLENIALGQNLCAGIRFERVLGVGVEVVVHGV
jgi:hypothetical protein